MVKRCCGKPFGSTLTKNYNLYRYTTITTVTVNPLPIVIANTTSVCEGLTTTLTASGASSYLWSNSSTANPVSVSPIKTTQYSVIGTDANGCKAKATSNVTVFPKPATDFTISPQPVLRFLTLRLPINHRKM
jgi:hypothetical protein